MSEYLAYVRFADVDAYMARGWWVVSALGGSHGLYSVLMKACCCYAEDGKP